MNLATIPNLPPLGWLLLCVTVIICFAVFGYSLDRKRERLKSEKRAAERAWPESRGTIISLKPRPDGPEIVVSVPSGPRCGTYRFQVSGDLASGCAINKEVICRIGRYPDDRVEDPLRCVITQVL